MTVGTVLLVRFLMTAGTVLFVRFFRITGTLQFVLRIFRRNRINDMLRFRGREQDKLQGARFFAIKKMTMRTVPLSSFVLCVDYICRCAVHERFYVLDCSIHDTLAASLGCPGDVRCDDAVLGLEQRIVPADWLC